MGMEGIGLLFEEHAAPSSTARITVDVDSSRAQGALLHACGALRVGGAQDAAGHRRVDWLCLAALLLNGVALAIGLPFFLMASGR